MGTGKYGFLLREQFDLAGGRVARDEWELRLDGVEGFPPYVGPHQRAVYDEIIIKDVREYLASAKDGQYDWALALDIIEHFTPSDAVSFIDQALTVARFVFVSTPKGFYPQRDERNVLETHKSWWPRKCVRALAKTCNANVTVAQVRMVNLAVLSRHENPPPIPTERIFEVGAFMKDRLLPERLYYRAIKKAGPTILDQGA
jgi:hypothetical protein